MRRYTKVLLSALLAVSSTSFAADIQPPVRGELKAQIQQHFGQPVKKTPAVGEPPISSWEYQNFTVFFEDDRVIHTVVKGQGLATAEEAAQQPASTSTPAPAQNNTFKDATTGLKITKPAAWHFVSEEQYKLMMEKLKLENAELEAQVKANSTPPLVAIVKYLEPYNNVNPAISISAYPVGIDGVPPKNFLYALTNAAAQIYKGYAMQGEPITLDMNIPGANAAKARMTYITILPDGKEVTTLSEVIAIKTNKYYFAIQWEIREDQATATVADIEAILKTLSID